MTLYGGITGCGVVHQSKRPLTSSPSASSIFRSVSAKAPGRVSISALSSSFDSGTCCGLMVKGQRMKEIATNLGLSVRTVETHRYEMMEVLGLHSTAELARYALDRRLTLD